MPHISIQVIGLFVTIGLFVISLVLGWFGYLLKRFIGMQDTLTEAMFYPHGPIAQIKTEITGIHQQLPTFVKADKLELTERRLHDSIEAMRREGDTRESRILEAVGIANDSNKADNERVRTEITGVHNRIDRLFEQQSRRRYTDPPRAPEPA